MENLSLHHEARSRAGGTQQIAIIGIVASGNLEVLVERVMPNSECQVVIKTPVEGFSAVWTAVVADFVERHSPGGLRFSINDGGAGPDVVSLRLTQATRLMQGNKS